MNLTRYAQLLNEWGRFKPRKSYSKACIFNHYSFSIGLGLKGSQKEALDSFEPPTVNYYPHHLICTQIITFVNHVGSFLIYLKVVFNDFSPMCSLSIMLFLHISSTILETNFMKEEKQVPVVRVQKAL